jgi:spore coat-associated protein N
MKRKIAVSFLIMALVCALVGGATFALFTDSAANEGNTFSAGTVIIGAGPQTFTVPVNNMAPGDTINGTFVVSNEGTLDAWFKVTANTSGKLFTFDNNKATVTFSNTEWTAISSGANATVNFSVNLPFDADNNYQGASGDLSFTVDAEQQAHNPKS